MMCENFVSPLKSFKFIKSPVLFFGCDSMGARWLSENLFTISTTGGDFVVDDGLFFGEGIGSVSIKLSADGSAIKRGKKYLYSLSLEKGDCVGISEGLKKLAEDNIPGHIYHYFDNGDVSAIVFSKDEYNIDIIREMRKG